MTVKELINILKTMPQDALVVTEGYEDGFDAVIAGIVAQQQSPQLLQTFKISPLLYFQPI